jgi:hypothetical protein
MEIIRETSQTIGSNRQTLSPGNTEYMTLLEFETELCVFEKLSLCEVYD